MRPVNQRLAFYAKVKFDHLSFCMDKRENYFLFGKYCSHRSRSWHYTKWIDELNEYQRSSSFFYLGQRSLRFKIKSCFFSETKFHMKAYGWVTWPRCPPFPYMDKPFKSLLQNQWTDDLETWHVALGTRVLKRLFKWWPWVDLDLFSGYWPI